MSKTYGCPNCRSSAPRSSSIGAPRSSSIGAPRSSSIGASSSSIGAPRSSAIDAPKKSESPQVLYEDPYNLEVVCKKGQTYIAYPLKVVSGRSTLSWEDDDGNEHLTSVPVSMMAVKRRPASRLVGKQSAPEDRWVLACSRINGSLQRKISARTYIHRNENSQIWLISNSTHAHLL